MPDRPFHASPLTVIVFTLLASGCGVEGPAASPRPTRIALREPAPVAMGLAMHAVRLVPDGVSRADSSTGLVLGADGSLERDSEVIGRFDGLHLVVGGRPEVTVDRDWTIHVAGRADLEMHFQSSGNAIIYRPPGQLAAVLAVDESGVPGFWCAGRTEPIQVKAHVVGHREEMKSIVVVLTLFAARETLLEAVPVVPPDAGSGPQAPAPGW